LSGSCMLRLGGEVVKEQNTPAKEEEIVLGKV
jgi:hypothetical protein